MAHTKSEARKALAHKGCAARAHQQAHQIGLGWPSQERAEGFGGEAGLPKNRDERAGRKRPVPVDGDRDVLAGRTDEADVAARLAFDGEAGALEGADASGPLGGLTWRVRGRRRFRRAPRPGAGAVRPARPCPPG